jgi:hypothetical protein
LHDLGQSLWLDNITRGILNDGTLQRYIGERRQRLRFAQPTPRLSGVGVIEVSGRRFRERLEERRHAVLPFRIPDHREPVDVGEVLEVELGVLPHRAGIPAVETGHIEEHAQFSVLPEESLELGHKVHVIRLGQLPAEVNHENLPAVFRIESNGHFGLLEDFRS